MDKSNISVLQQKAHKTYKRNQYIRFLYREEKNMAELGRQFKLSRQTIRHIIQEASDHE